MVTIGFSLRVFMSILDIPDWFAQICKNFFPWKNRTVLLWSSLIYWFCWITSNVLFKFSEHMASRLLTECRSLLISKRVISTQSREPNNRKCTWTINTVDNLFNSNSFWKLLTRFGFFATSSPKTTHKTTAKIKICFILLEKLDFRIKFSDTKMFEV